MTKSTEPKMDQKITLVRARIASGQSVDEALLQSGLTFRKYLHGLVKADPRFRRLRAGDPTMKLPPLG